VISSPGVGFGDPVAAGLVPAACLLGLQFGEDAAVLAVVAVALGEALTVSLAQVWPDSAELVIGDRLACQDGQAVA